MSLATVHYLSMVGKGGRLDGFTSTGLVGDEVTLSVSSLTPGEEYGFDWGDDSTSGGLADVNGVISSAHTYTEEGVYTIRVFRDSDNRTVFRYKVTQAQKTGGTIELLDEVLEENTEADFGVSGLSEDTALVINWGDDVSEPFSTDSSGEAALEHTYDSYGEYSITVTDEEVPANNLASLNVEVDHREGSLVWSVLSVVEAVQNTLNGTGFAFDRSYDIDWGDEASSVAETSGSGAFTATHTYAAADDYVVTVSDGEFVAATLNVTVTAPAPPE